MADLNFSSKVLNTFFQETQNLKHRNKQVGNRNHKEIEKHIC